MTGATQLTDPGNTPYEDEQTGELYWLAEDGVTRLAQDPNRLRFAWIEVRCWTYSSLIQGRGGPVEDGAGGVSVGRSRPMLRYCIWCSMCNGRFYSRDGKRRCLRSCPWSPGACSLGRSPLDVCHSQWLLPYVALECNSCCGWFGVVLADLLAGSKALLLLQSGEEAGRLHLFGVVGQEGDYRRGTVGPGYLL